MCALATLVVSCGSQSPSNGETGSIAIGIQVGNSFSAKPDASAGGERWAVDCAATGISTISASVTNSSGTSVKTGGPWTCTTGSGTISAVPTGTNYTVTLSGKNSSGATIFTGTKTGVTVTSGATTSAGAVTLSGAAWTAKTSMGTARHRLGVVSPSCTSCTTGSDGEPIYAIGGLTDTSGNVSTNKVEMFSSNIWTSKTSLTTSRGGLAVAAVPGTTSYGKIYAIGGWNGTSILNTVEEYDPSANTWTAKTNMTTARDNFAACVVSGIVYAIGGWSGSAYLSSVEAYNPTTNTWSTKTSMSVARETLTCSVVNGKIYAIGGDSSTNFTLTTVEEYNPSTNTWTTKTSMPTSRRYLTSTAVNNKIYVIGGADSTNTVSKVVEVYDPATDTWTTGVSLTLARSSLGAAAITVSNVAKIYSIGGWSGSAGVAEANEFIP
ncbi:MAG: hypothetical protein HZA04_10015 [Nitrospinae bacterium]|nr:hypothetical protein [Nitrospinota bacterium]